MSSLEKLLSSWKRDEHISLNIVQWDTQDAISPELEPFPADLHPVLRNVFDEQGYQGIYNHQRRAIELARQRENVVVVTGTASGKTLCYNLPVLDDILNHPQVNALYLFPTKALTADQQDNLDRLITQIEKNIRETVGGNNIGHIICRRYDGDTPQSSRAKVRKEAKILLTNPDMLHMGILPHHTAWASFLKSLKYIVIDEIHIYRGIFGSHVSNVIRRLKRICNFYGAYPQFIMTSATISNPDELSGQLIGEPVIVVDRDGSPKGKRHFLLYNPPVINKELGLRLGASTEAVRLTSDLLANHIQTLIFNRARRSVEMLLVYLKDQLGNDARNIRGYRSGYLPAERREIELRLRDGLADVVVATNALELGVDIGGMQAVLLIGYPGTIAATFQQAGRAGRRGENDSSIAVLIATSNPIDQFLMKNPSFLFNKKAERALIDPDNLLILFNHLKCAAFELPFTRNETFGNVDHASIESILEVIEQSGLAYRSKDKLLWVSDQYPASEVSLRNAGEGNVLLQVEQEEKNSTVGQVDKESAVWMAHPGAVYLHDGKSFFVEQLDLQQNAAFMREATLDYFTEPKFQIVIENLTHRVQTSVRACTIAYSDIQVVSTVVGFRRIQWNTREVLDEEELEMPPVKLNTTAYTLILNEETVECLKDSGLWNNDVNQYGSRWEKQRELARARDRYRCMVCGVQEGEKAHHVHHIIPMRNFTDAEKANRLDNLITLCPSCHRRAETMVKMKSGLSGLRYVLHQFAPFFIMCDATDLGSLSDIQLPGMIDSPFIILYEQVPAGTGLAKAIYDAHEEIVSNAYHLVEQCECEDGCPSCTGPAGENGLGGKNETLAILSLLSGNTELPIMK